MLIAGIVHLHLSYPLGSYTYLYRYKIHTQNMKQDRMNTDVSHVYIDKVTADTALQGQVERKCEVYV